MTSSTSYNSPCAACKFLRRKCISGCIFAPYFPPEDPQKFINVHKIFGASNVTKLLNDVLPHQRADAVSSLAYEAEARVRDPVYGCVGVIAFMQRQVDRLQKDLDIAKADLIGSYARSGTLMVPAAMPACLGSNEPVISRQRRFGGGGIGGFYQPPVPPPPPPPPPAPTPPSYHYHNVNRPWNCHYPSNYFRGSMSGGGSSSGGGGGGGGGGGN
ncbi:hypothetical protein OSB04_004716 [Centaurea solstitialis]|uniref:LOB domain-containing protein n=1 Tax=Centaurea solstitialis TaxID=347529 RepID=A0AA38TQ74_9ASTR|nr:hypothetical protein OSB04_004716 [Centaurea solstitialis]